MVDYENMREEDVQAAQEQAMVINKLLVGTFGADIGAKCLKHLKKTFVDRPIYIAGMTPDQVAYRQGECDVIRQIIKTVEQAQGELDD